MQECGRSSDRTEVRRLSCAFFTWHSVLLLHLKSKTEMNAEFYWGRRTLC